ncbi:G2/mitotic-specific cyclin cig1 [Golovinomyces cichoracearum]|uniref:G2/mitotic-specific cyclin cig1 n=1 Tax=Golovinomyces cichoracearum TaxID=62708 RepID=A0A420IBH6_9PEZI|nr:G2/mitotic-specific cyclin cig1 [Golovinomyces cichoracearum]
MQPQRPIRIMRAQTDENCVPAAHNKPLLHHRQKSANQVALLPVGRHKATARRTAFGDVSNTAKTLSKSREDSGQIQNNLDKCVKLHERKSASCIKQVQKSLPVATNRFPQSNSKTLSEIHNKALSGKITLPKSQISVKRSLSRRETTVHKDIEKKNKVQTNYQASRLEPIQGVLPTGNEHHSEYQNIHTKSTQEFQKNEQNLPLLEEKRLKDSDNQNISRSNNEKVITSLDKHIHSSAGILNEENRRIDDMLNEDRDLEIDLKEKSYLPPHSSELGEYWEDEEESCDNQGHLTSHSFHSFGDNTTSGMTTILYPIVTKKIEQELESARKHTEKFRTAEDIGDERWDTSMVAEYADEIFTYMRELETKMLPEAHYMDIQTEIQWSMRSVLMDWLIQVHHRFSLLPETLFLCVNYVDRFLSSKIVSLAKLQLVGATAIFVAAKYEEINCPSVNEIVYMVDGGYTADEILKAERFMLNMLQFELGWPGPMSFLRRISKADEYDLDTRTLAKYFLEVTIMDERFVGSPSSYIAAGSHCLARLMLRKGDWTKQHVHYSGYTWNQLRPLVVMIKECCAAPQKHHKAVFEKYSDRRFNRAAQFVSGEIGNFTLPSIQHSQPSLFSNKYLVASNPNVKQETLRHLVKS